VLHLLAEEDDPLAQEPRVDVEGAFVSAVLRDVYWSQCHSLSLIMCTCSVASIRNPEVADWRSRGSDPRDRLPRVARRGLGGADGFPTRRGGGAARTAARPTCE